MPTFNWWVALPTLVPAAYGLLLLVFTPALRNDRRWLWGFAVAGMLVSTAVPLIMLGRIGSVVDFAATAGVAGREMVRTDRLALWIDFICALAGVMALLFMPRYLERARGYHPEVFPLLFFSVAGMTMMVGTDNLLMIFLGLEILSIPLYVLTALTRDKSTAVEAGFKYFILGAFSTAFLVYGIALVLGATGRLDLGGIVAVVREASALAPYGKAMLLVGSGLLLVGFAFKVAAVPFHFWAPDVYTGAPTPITGFMAAATKAAAFGVLIRLVGSAAEASPELAARGLSVLAVLAAATMVVGNLVALVQTRVKRMLAYSSIAHAGYLLLALMTPVAVSTSSIVFYLLSYTFMTVGAFAVVSLFQQDGEDADSILNFKGLVQRQPVLAWTMGLFLVSLIGIPPTGGFTGKYVIFLAALDAGHGVLAALMGVTAVVGAAYYLRVIVAMFFEAPETEVSEGITVPVGTAIVLATAVAGTILLGVYPGLVLEPLSRVGTGLLAAIR